MAEREVRDLIRPQEPKRVKIEDIQRVVARQYNVSRADLLSSRRTANVVRPRQIAMYLAKTLTLRSLPEIGRRFGGRDHTTVLHAVRKIEGLVGNGHRAGRGDRIAQAAAAGISGQSRAGAGVRRPDLRGIRCRQRQLCDQSPAACAVAAAADWSSRPAAIASAAEPSCRAGIKA